MLMFCECGVVVQTHTLIRHREMVNSVAFSPDGKHIVSGSKDMDMIMWDAKKGVQVCNLI